MRFGIGGNVAAGRGFFGTLEVSGADAVLDGGLFTWPWLREWPVARWVGWRLGRWRCGMWG